MTTWANSTKHTATYTNASKDSTAFVNESKSGVITITTGGMVTGLLASVTYPETIATSALIWTLETKN
jgi:hypothetical protein